MQLCYYLTSAFIFHKILLTACKIHSYKELFFNFKLFKCRKNYWYLVTSSNMNEKNDD